MSQATDVDFILELENLNTIRLPQVPLLKLQEHTHLKRPETCLHAHGFFDVEKLTCTTVHRLASLCVKLDYEKDAKEWHLEPAQFSSENSSSA